MKFYAWTKKVNSYLANYKENLQYRLNTNLICS